MHVYLIHITTTSLSLSLCILLELRREIIDQLTTYDVTVFINIYGNRARRLR